MLGDVPVSGLTSLHSIPASRITLHVPGVAALYALFGVCGVLCAVSGEVGAVGGAEAEFVEQAVVVYEGVGGVAGVLQGSAGGVCLSVDGGCVCGFSGLCFVGSGCVGSDA